MSRNPLLDLTDLDQSIWLDFLSRETSIPSILEEAILGTTDYDKIIASLTDSDRGRASIYTTLAVNDVG